MRSQSQRSPSSRLTPGIGRSPMTEDAAGFYTDLMEEVAAGAAANGEFTRPTLVANLAARLVEAEELQDWIPCFYDGIGQRGRILGLDGYSADDLEIDGTLQVLIGAFHEGGAAEALTTADIS